MSSVFGRIFKISTFGESHGPAVGVVIEGVPAGIPLDLKNIQTELDRRRPGTSKFVSQRNERDTAEILSGTAEGKTLGSPIAVVVKNTQARSKDYEELKNVFRPGHADYTYFKKFGIKPQPGGGRASGRETVGRVAAGAVAKSLLAPLGIQIRAFVRSVHNLVGLKIDLDFSESHPLRCADPNVATEMENVVQKALRDGDSLGGIVEVLIKGVPPGLGDPVFNKLDALFGWAFFSIGGVKGVEIGSGFAVCKMMGSECNDQITSEGFETNNAGGILGGISTGQDIVVRLAVKPTPSISQTQRTINIDNKNELINIKGRHDPCICPRVVPVAEAMAALVLADAYLFQRSVSRNT